MIHRAYRWEKHGEKSRQHADTVKAHAMGRTDLKGVGKARVGTHKLCIVLHLASGATCQMMKTSGKKVKTEVQWYLLHG